MKKNKAMRVASAMLVAALLTTCVISGTFAKYTSSASGTDTATVAKWSFKVNAEQIAKSGDEATVKFNLFDTIKDEDGTKETDVIADKIAPGTSGSFAITLSNDSEVNAKYTIALNETNDSNVPIQYSLDGATYGTLASLATALTDQSIEMTSGSETKTIYWKWAYDGEDTSLGIAAQTTAPTVTVNAKITATQVN